jgi:uncharacterized protein YdeI (YjbR/CyaY-like superfamily)
MKPKNVDEYLKKLEGHFAHPILHRVREVVLDTSSEITEEIKWGTPSFEYKGLMMSMAAFKKFAAVWFHKGALLNDPHNLLEASAETTKSMRKYIIPTIEDLDEDGLRALIVEAMAKNDNGEEVAGMGVADKKYMRSEMLDLALQQSENGEAARTYQSLTDYKKREYAEYIEEAKRQDTRQRRLEKSLDLLKQGLGLNDKYR